MTNTEAITAKALAAGAIAGTAGAEMWQIIIVGLIGGIVGWLKRYDHDKFKEDKAGTIMAIPYAILVPTALTATVYYAGTDCVNTCWRDMGTMVWTFVAFLAALYYDTVLNGIGGFLPSVLEKFGIKQTKKEPMSDYEGDDDF